jgi:hypothetical protein
MNSKVKIIVETFLAVKPDSGVQNLFLAFLAFVERSLFFSFCTVCRPENELLKKQI